MLCGALVSKSAMKTVWKIANKDNEATDGEGKPLSYDEDRPKIVAQTLYWW